MRSAGSERIPIRAVSIAAVWCRAASCAAAPTSSCAGGGGGEVWESWRTCASCGSPCSISRPAPSGRIIRPLGVMTRRSRAASGVVVTSSPTAGEPARLRVGHRDLDAGRLEQLAGPAAGAGRRRVSAVQLLARGERRRTRTAPLAEEAADAGTGPHAQAGVASEREPLGERGAREDVALAGKRRTSSRRRVRSGSSSLACARVRRRGGRAARASRRAPSSAAAGVRVALPRQRAGQRRPGGVGEPLAEAPPRASRPATLSSR